MSGQPTGWANGDPWHAAGGRRKWNAERQARARLRQAALIHVLATERIDLFAPGTQRRLAERFGVHPSTITRDLQALFRRNPG